MAKEIKSIWILIASLAVFSMISYALIQLEIVGYNSDLEKLNTALQNEIDLDNMYVQKLKSKVDSGEITVGEFQTKLIKIAKGPVQLNLIDENDLVGKLLAGLGLSQ